MRLKIWHKLAFLLVATTGLTIVIGIGLSQLSFKSGFLEYLQQQENRRLKMIGDDLITAYEANGDWEFIRNNRWLWFSYVRPRPGYGRFRDNMPMHRGDEENALNGHRMRHHGMPGPASEGSRFSVMALLDSNKQYLVGWRFTEEETSFYPLMSRDKIIGFIQSEKNVQLRDKLDEMFEAQQNRSFIINTLVAVVLSLAVAVLASIYLRKRINGLTAIAHHLTSGGYDKRVAVKSSDELGQLGANFNVLAQTLQKNQQSQKQWIADISHELRTPVSILKGELEALADGVRPLNESSIVSLQQETERLGKLIDDLYQLSIADMGALRYEKTSFILYDLLTELHDAFKLMFAKQDIEFSLLKTKVPELLFNGDRQRLHQLFCNLLENSLRYTDAGGKVLMQMMINGNNLIITIEDSSPGIEKEKLTQIFNRLYRVESSRNRSKGGAGLGLAIARQIVQAHRGEITAAPSELGGITIRCSFPLQ